MSCYSQLCLFLYSSAFNQMYSTLKHYCSYLLAITELHRLWTMNWCSPVIVIYANVAKSADIHPDLNGSASILQSPRQFE